jgi:hypothetical protein
MACKIAIAALMEVRKSIATRQWKSVQGQLCVVQTQMLATAYNYNHLNNRRTTDIHWVIQNKQCINID